MARRNWEAIQRGRKARYLMRCVDALGIPYKEVAQALGVSVRRIRHLASASPQLEVLHDLGAYVEEQARSREQN